MLVTQAPGFSKSFAWSDTAIYIATPFALDMGRRMGKYVEESRGGTPFLPYSTDLRKNMVATLGEWLRFQKDPAAYAEGALLEYQSWTVKQARRQLVDREFEKGKSPSSVVSRAAASTVVERDLLFYQHAFVAVHANPHVLSPDEARIHLHESWRFRVMVLIGNEMVQQPVDFGSFRCIHCRQYAKYGFCGHCILVGIMQRKGRFPLVGYLCFPSIAGVSVQSII